MALNRLAVATDFSDGAQLAVARAEALARVHGVPELALIHVLDASLMDAVFSPASLTTGREALQKQANEALHAAATSLDPKLDAELQTILTEGALVPALTEAASGSDLLLMGARGAHWVRELALGNTAYRVALHSAVPVLVVRQAAQGGYVRVVVATDFSDSALRAARFASNLLTDQTRVDVFHAFSSLYDLNLLYANVGEQAIADAQARSRIITDQSIKEFVVNAGLSNARAETIVESGHAAQALLQYAEKVGADLLVLGKQGKSALGDLAMGSICQRALSGAGCDVLIVP
jgi:nucleotide-binding universal stress UspA family protein